jgi:site-specific DNA recombinase
VLLSVAQWERETNCERTREALQHKISRGERCGKIRYGYNLADDGKTLVANSDEQSAITTMVQLRNAGQTLRAIAAELTQRGIPTKESGSAWSYAAVRRILNRQEQTAA